MAINLNIPFQPDAWRETIWAITSVFESGTPTGNPAAFQNFDAGIISYGKHQATLASGVLARVLAGYFQRSSSATSQALETEFFARVQAGDASLRNNNRLKTLLLEAAAEPAMEMAQDEVFDRDFYQPAAAVARRLAIATPLGLSTLYDTRIQGGLSIVTEAVNNRLGGNGVGRIGVSGLIDEETWVRTFHDEREARLLRLADRAQAQGNEAQARALRISTFRVTELRALTDAANWGLSGDFTVRGQSIPGLTHPGTTVILQSGSEFVRFQSSADLNAAPEGSTFSATWRMRNTGNTTWDAAYRLTHVGQGENSRLMASQTSFTLDELGGVPVSPGSEVDIKVEMKAPPPGFYSTEWQLQDSQGVLFGHTMWLNVVTIAAQDDGGGFLSSDSIFVDDLTIPDDKIIPAGSAFTKQWLVRNTGQRVWGDGYRLVFVGGDAAMTGTFSHLVPRTEPGGEAVLSVPMVAPLSPGTYVGTWRLRDNRNIAFGDRFWVKIVVTAADQSLPVTPLSQNDPRWRDKILGQGPKTFGQFGCLLTCYTMMLNAFGEDLTPLDLNTSFLSLPPDQGFDGSVVFFAAPAKAFNHVEFKGNFKPRPETGAAFAIHDPDLIGRIDNHLAAGGVALAQVDLGPATAFDPSVEQHWVMLVSRSGSDYLVLDPLDGQATSLLDKYGQQNRPQAPEEALKDAIKSALLYRSSRTEETPAASAGIEAGMNVNPDDAISNPLDSDVLEGLAWIRFPFKAADKVRTVAESFAEYDLVVQSYAQKGVGSIIVLNQQTVAGNTAPWLPGGGDWAAYAARFTEVAGEIAAHYAHLEDKVAYEIWNEGDNPATPFVSVFVPPAEFALVLGGAAGAIRAAAPQAKVIFGGLSTGPIESSAYVKQTRVALGGSLPVDAIGIHPYGRWPIVRPFPGWGFGTLAEAFQVFKTEFPDTPLWITEIGIPGGPNPLGEEHYPAIARYLRDVFTHVAQENARQVPVVVWFAWSDNMENAGIVKSDGGHKAEIFGTFAAIRDRTLPGLS